NVLNSFSVFSRIGLFHRNNTNSWVWPNGSTFSSKLFSISSEGDGNCAFLDFPENRLSSESCLAIKMYVCKHQAF
ncbi:hypothetical protein HPG69_004138, partial [Diceros bicornis minor]